jgi:succinate dehydrogenase / fumarate reductase flavoprotein subunit
MSTVPGCFVLGEANFSDHGANRLGASALMQGLSDGYFVIPYTIGDYLANLKPAPIDAGAPEFKAAEQETRARLEKLLAIKGKRTPTSFHRELGKIMWDKCGMARNRAGLTEGIEQIQALRQEFWTNVNVIGEVGSLSQQLEIAARVADFIELGELMCRDALHREESAGGHFREEYQTEDGEALRNDEEFAYAAAWEYTGEQGTPRLNKEQLEYENVKLSTRSYK